MTHILIAEDEQRIASFIEKGLSANGFAVTTVADGRSAYDYAATGKFDLMVLDIGLPELDGFEVLLRRLRSEGHRIPVIVLTARRVCATLSPGSRAVPTTTWPSRFDSRSCWPVSACDSRRRIPRTNRYCHAAVCNSICAPAVPRSTARTVDLSAREFALVETFLRHAGQVLSREQLLSQVWGYDYDPGSNVVDVYVRYLRRKLGADRFVTLRGMGYRLDAVP